MKKLISLFLTLSMTVLCSCTANMSISYNNNAEEDDEDRDNDNGNNVDGIEKDDENDNGNSVGNIEKDDENDKDTVNGKDDTPASVKVEKPDAVVTVEYIDLDPGTAYATAYYASPVLELAKSADAADALNNGETLTSIVNGSKTEAQNIIEYALETPDIAENYAFFYDSYVDYVSVSDAHVCYGFTDSAYAGGAHPNSASGYFNFDIASGKLLTVDDILDSANTNAKAELEGAIVAELDENDTWTFSSYESIAAEFTSGDAGNIWRLEPDALVLSYSPYMIAPYAAGFIEVRVSYEDIPGVIRQSYIPTVDEGSATFDIVPASSERALKADHHYGKEASAALVASGDANNVTVKALSRSNAVIFYASSFDGCMLYLEEGDTYTITYNGGETVTFEA